MSQRQIEELKAKVNIFLIGMLSGVVIAAAFTYIFAIPANSYHWKTEIWRRGGAVWTFDKNGHSAWKWLVDPFTNVPRQKQVVAPPAAVKVRGEQL